MFYTKHIKKKGLAEDLFHVKTKPTRTPNVLYYATYSSELIQKMNSVYIVYFELKFECVHRVHIIYTQRNGLCSDIVTQEVGTVCV